MNFYNHNKNFRLRQNFRANNNVKQILHPNHKIPQCIEAELNYNRNASTNSNNKLNHSTQNQQNESPPTKINKMNLQINKGCISKMKIHPAPSNNATPT